MTLRELINSVDSEQYGDSPLYQKLRETKPEYGSNRHIQVKLLNGDIAITNVQLLDAILHELSSNGFSDSEASDFWSDFDNLQKSKVSQELQIEYYN